ncbi:hypothetical protein D1872_307580 [compost metagenome]
MAKRLLEGESAGSAVGAGSTSKPAASLLERAVRLDPLSVDAQVWLAIAYTELEQYDRALSAVQEASVLPQDVGIAKQLQELEQRIRKHMK